MAIENEFDELAFREWMETQPQEIKANVALRCLLRALPLMHKSPFEERRDREIVFSFYGAAFIEWAAITYGSTVRNESLEIALNEAINVGEGFKTVFFDDYRASFASAVQTLAANILKERQNSSVVSSERAQNPFIDVVFRVLTSLILLNETNHKNFISELLSDRDLIEQGISIAEFRKIPLWRMGRVPDVVLELIDKLGLLKGIWEIWAGWYEDTVLGDIRNESLHVRIANFPEKTWEKGIEYVDSEIRRVAIFYGGFRRRETQRTVADFQEDYPANKDHLGRGRFASVIALQMGRRFRRARQNLSVSGAVMAEAERSLGFATLLHAPWGKGKTSLWNFLKDDLESGALSYMVDGKEFKSHNWVTVEFNAWEHEHRNKPWWPFLQSCNNWIGKSQRNKRWQKISDWLNWKCWLIRYPYMPHMAVGFGSCIFLVIYWFFFRGTTEAFEDFVLGTQALLVSVGIIYFLGRGWAFGTKKIADFHDDLSKSQTTHLSKLFASMVAPSTRPICIFIDDLDRCNAEYVVQFLEGLQTHFRASNVFYVVAADQKWLRSAFEQHYQGFQKDISRQGEYSLGLLFLEKIFQLSVGVPDASDAALDAYWKKLLADESDERLLEKSGGDGNDPSADGASNEAGSSSGVKDTDPLSQQKQQTEKAVEQAGSGEADKQIKHLLSQLSSVLPNNPRSLKRMINLYSIYLVSRSIVGADDELPLLAMARWIIFEQRFLELSEALLEEPARVDELLGEKATLKDGEKDIIGRMVEMERSKRSWLRRK